MSECKIVLAGKNRNGSARYWCTEHHAPAYGKNGIKLDECLAIFKDIDRKKSSVDLNPEEFPGGIALWGCAPAVYDTTSFHLNPGVHVHGRREMGKEKEIDKTYGIVNVRVNDEYVSFNDLAAISYLSSKILNHEMVYLECPHCGAAHLDKDWFAANPHKRHLCSACGRHFNVKEPNIGNPIMKAKAIFGDEQIHGKIIRPNRTLNISQKDFPYGISIWASNSALLRTSPKTEEYGIHVHAFKENCLRPTIDETYDTVIIDGVALDIEQVHLYMVQKTLPYLNDRISVLKCPNCGEMIFDTGLLSYTPTNLHACPKCNNTYKTHKKLVSNPFINVIKELHQFTDLPLRDAVIEDSYPDLAGW